MADGDNRIKRRDALKRVAGIGLGALAAAAGGLVAGACPGDYSDYYNYSDYSGYVYTNYYVYSGYYNDSVYTNYYVYSGYYNDSVYTNYYY